MHCPSNRRGHSPRWFVCTANWSNLKKPPYYVVKCTTAQSQPYLPRHSHMKEAIRKGRGLGLGYSMGSSVIQASVITNIRLWVNIKWKKIILLSQRRGSCYSKVLIHITRDVLETKLMCAPGMEYYLMHRYVQQQDVGRIVAPWSDVVLTLCFRGGDHETSLEGRLCNSRKQLFTNYFLLL